MKTKVLILTKQNKKMKLKLTFKKIIINLEHSIKWLQ